MVMNTNSGRKNVPRRGTLHIVIGASKMLVNLSEAESLLQCIPQSVFAALTQTGVTRLPIARVNILVEILRYVTLQMFAQLTLLLFEDFFCYVRILLYFCMVLQLFHFAFSTKYSEISVMTKSRTTFCCT